MYRFILGINSYWLLLPLYEISITNNYLIYIHTILTSLISSLFWFSNYNKLLHNIDRINAITYYFHLLYRETTYNYFLFICVIIFYILSNFFSYKEKYIESLFAHLTFRKCGLCIIYLQLTQKPENIYIILILFYLHLFYLLVLNNKNILLRSLEFFMAKLFIIYFSSNIYPIMIL
jgi:hypothetical protein